MELYEMLEILISMLATATGTCLGIFGAQKLLDWYHRPILKFVRADKFRVIDSKGRKRAVYHRIIIITNKGKSVAKNCKPEIKLVGEGRFSYISGEPGKRVRKERIEGAVCWSEIGNPCRISINPGEEVAFDIL